MEIDKALSEDPNVYEYDSIYDNIVASKSAACAKNTTQTKEKKASARNKLIFVNKQTTNLTKLLDTHSRNYSYSDSSL